MARNRSVRLMAAGLVLFIVGCAAPVLASPAASGAAVGVPGKYKLTFHWNRIGSGTSTFKFAANHVASTIPATSTGTWSYAKPTLTVKFPICLTVYTGK